MSRQHLPRGSFKADWKQSHCPHKRKACTYKITKDFRGDVFFCFEEELFPFPKVNSSLYPILIKHKCIIPRYIYSKWGRSLAVYKKKTAFELIDFCIKVECEKRVKEVEQEGVIVNTVIWRHTGGYGNQARNFLFINHKREICLLAKVGRRYRFFSSNNEDYILSHLPDHLAESGVKAYFKWKDTGEVSWWQSVVSFKDKKNETL